MRLIGKRRASHFNGKALGVTGYMDRCGTREGHLIIFDRSERKWEDKIYRDETSSGFYTFAFGTRGSPFHIRIWNQGLSLFLNKWCHQLSNNSSSFS